MKRFVQSLVIALPAFTACVGSATASTTLIDYTFGGSDSGPAIQVVDNGVSSGSANTNSGLITTGISDYNNLGFNSSQLVGSAPYSSLTASLVIDSITMSGGVTDLLANGLFFGIVAGPTANDADATGTGGDNLWCNDPISIGYLPGSDSWGDHKVAHNDGTRSGSHITTDNIASSAPGNASLIDGFTVSITVSNDNTWTISSTGLDNDLSDSGSMVTDFGATYADLAYAGLYVSLQGEAGATIDMGRMTLTGTVDTDPPTAGPLSPTNGAIDVAVDTDFMISFFEAVTDGAGSILINKTSDDATHETIAVTNASKVIFSTTNVTINVDADLTTNTAYYILITNGVIEDLAGNPFAGLTNTTDWAFTTAATLPRIYEPFDYAAGAIDGSSQNGGTGMAGAWETAAYNHGSATEYEIVASGLTFSDLTTTGGMVQRPSYPGDAELHRDISAGSKTAFLGDNSTIWFSILMRDAHYYDEHAQDAFLLATGPITGSGSKPVTIAGGEGFGVSFKNAFDGMDVHAIAIDGGSSSLSAGFIDDSDGSENITYLILGKIDWASNGSNDTLRLFNILDPLAAEPEEGDAFATMTADLDQSAFDTLAMGTAQRCKFDEIRFALNYYEALGREVPPPSGTLFLFR